MPDSIENRASFDTIRYANCWEDPELLIAALEPGPGKRILSIASAGDNSFSLLASGAEVVAADLSLAQLACVDLRRVAIAQLNDNRLLAFLGIAPADNRWHTYRQLSGELQDASRSYWDSQEKVIAHGIIHAGKFESYFRLFRTRILPWIHGQRKIERLLEEKSLDDQVLFYDRHWNHWRWRLLFKLFFSRWVMGRLGRDPEFFRFVDGSVAAPILERTRYALTAIPTHDNPYLKYIVTGNFGAVLPHYLRPENLRTIRENLDRLTLFHGPIHEAAKAHHGAGFDGYNLSDIFEYLDESECESVYGELLKTARPEARLAYWNMLVPRAAPNRYAENVQFQKQLAADCLKKDRAWFYSRFVVEQLRSHPLEK